MQKEKLYIVADPSGGDAAAIRAAVAEAVREDIRAVVIPARETGESWEITEPVFLPNRITVLLDGCQVEAACPVFVNASADDPGTKSLGGEQQEIRIIGRGNAVILGTSHEPQLRLSNVKNFRIAGLAFRGGAGVELTFARFGKLQRLKFEDSRYAIDLREGCNNNIVEDILAQTREEAIRMTAGDSRLYGRGPELRDTIFCRIRAKTGGAPAVGIYGGEVPVYNLILRDLTDTTPTGVSVKIASAQGQDGLRDITLRGVKTCRSAVETASPCDGLYCGNLQVAEGCGQLIRRQENTREFLDPEQMVVEAPKFPEETADAPFLTPNDPAFYGETDAGTIQNTLDAAVAQGISTVVIPRRNLRTGRAVWEIEKAIRLPSNMTVVLWGCHLRQADFCYDNLFIGEGENITLTGVGDAVLDGGLHNGLKEKNGGKFGFPDIRVNALLRFENARNLRAEHFHIRFSRWYGMYLVGCSYVRISDIDFDVPPVFPDLGGVKLCSGCHHVLVENLTGIVGEDLVAVTGQAMDGRESEIHIHDIHLRNLKANASRCNMVRLLTHDGRRLYNVLVESVLDVSLAEQKKQPNAAVMVGCSGGFCRERAKLGDLTDVTVRDVCSRGSRIIEFGGTGSHVDICNCHSYSGAQFGLQCLTGGEVKHVHVRGLFFRCDQASGYMRGTATAIITDKAKFKGCVASLKDLRSEDFRVEHVFADAIGEGFQVTGGGKLEVTDFHYHVCGRAVATRDGTSSLTVNGEVIS